MKKVTLIYIKIIILILSLKAPLLYGVERIFSKYYYIQQGDDLTKIIKENIWFDKLKDEQKNKILKDLKKWNPHIQNWNKLSSGQRIYLEFEQRYSKNLPILIGGKKPSREIAVKKDKIKSDYKVSDSKRIPQSKFKSIPGKTLYKIMPYELDISLGGKFYSYTDAIAADALEGDNTMPETTDLAFNLDAHLLYPLKENLKFYFNFGLEYTKDQECDPNVQAYCEDPKPISIPLAFIIKSGIKRTLFSSTFKKGFSLYLGLEREELAYVTASKDMDKRAILEVDAMDYLKPGKSNLLWVTSGIEYNFSIFNKQSSLFALASYSISGSTQIKGAPDIKYPTTDYWEDIAGFKLSWGYKQSLTKSIWAKGYGKFLHWQGKYSFKSIQTGANIGYSF